jgi:hypothetical protein
MNKTLFAHQAAGCREPVARLCPGIYEHYGLRIVRVRGAWRLLFHLAQGRPINEYNTLADALDGAHNFGARTRSPA